jgi:hypothetical protein
LKVVVYVEGKGDRLCLEALLRPLLSAKESTGVSIQFFEMTSGDRKTSLLTHAPRKAANAIINDRGVTVVILPDLYPPNKAFEHSTCAQLQTEVLRRFQESGSGKPGWDDRCAERFRVFCMIHDLEVLLLAAEEQLLDYCGATRPTWTTPVEQQNNEDPPKRIVKRLLHSYEPTVDGPVILANADYRVIATRCPNGFGQFVAYLESL